MENFKIRRIILPMLGGNLFGAIFGLTVISIVGWIFGEPGELSGIMARIFTTEALFSWLRFVLIFDAVMLAGAKFIPGFIKIFMWAVTAASMICFFLTFSIISVSAVLAISNAIISLAIFCVGIWLIRNISKIPELAI